MSQREADVHGAQRKVVDLSVRPARAAFGDAGIPVRDGRTLPFLVERQWNAPAGNYAEQWFVVHPETREVLIEGPLRLIRVWGLQSVTDVADRMSAPVELPPGTYRLVFALDGVLAAEFDVEAVDVSAAAA